MKSISSSRSDGKLKKSPKSLSNKEDNIFIIGENYHALQCLSYTHNNAIDFIYIDPPYNTLKDGLNSEDVNIHGQVILDNGTIVDIFNYLKLYLVLGMLFSLSFLFFLILNSLQHMSSSALMFSVIFFILSSDWLKFP